MKCNNCNFDFNGNFCSNCGAPAGYNPNSVVPINQPITPKKKGLSGVGMAAAIVGGSVGVVLLFYVFMFSFILFEGLGEDSSGYPIVDNNSYYMNDTVTADDFSYTLTKAEFAPQTTGDKVNENYDILYIDIELKNNSYKRDYITTRFNVYADDYLCKLFDSNNEDYWDKGDTSEVELFPGKKYKYELEYMIPKDAQNVKLYVNTFDDWYDDIDDYEKQFTFTIK